MRYWVTLILFVLLPITGFTEGFATSHQEITFFDAVRERPIKTYLWFPSRACPPSGYCISDKANVTSPVLLSHGTMGSPLEYSWLAEALAQQGFIVIGVAHFGESWVYGADTIRPETIPQFWLRTGDIRFVLNALNKENPLDRAINWDNTTGIGHSAGGHTMLALAGAQFSTSQIAAYCQSDAALMDKGCAYGRGFKPSEAFSRAYGGHYQDKRITRVIALDPALGPAAIEQSLKNIKATTLIIGAKNNDFLPFNAHSKRYAEFIPAATLIGLNGNEGHFVFLNPCEHHFQAQGVALCQDAEGVNRVQTHRAILGDVLTFLGATGL